MKRVFLSLLIMLAALMHLTGQNHSLVGRVLDASDDLPLIGVTVILKGSLSGTVTDVEGSFSFSAIDPDAVLVISYMGY